MSTARNTEGQGVRLAVDGGATKLLMGVVDRSGPTPRLGEQVSVPGFQWTTGEDPIDQQCRRVVSAWVALGRPAPVEVVALGLAGGAYDRPSRERLAPLLAEQLGARTVLLTGDDVTAHLGVLGGDSGVVVTAGTGVNCLAVTPGGELTNIDGMGYLFGDAGGGFSLGLAGLRAAVAGYEGRGATTALTARAEERVGRPLREAVKAWYRSPSLIADVASFAAEVAVLAASDPVARVLCLSAGEELSVCASAAVRKAFPTAADGSVPVSWAGSVLGGPVIFDAFAAGLAQLCPAAELRDPRGDSLAGAARLAVDQDVPHLAGVVVHSAGAPTTTTAKS
ncbi:BadF/BadG/BcrA/BcrD ATPase family protein [Actinopolymorpha sp. B17G11]|uniref:N-acetylglucosamine kinase n=1 Tax=unclassified Actinopolymorpha TaxID=2627063 RepID=UPI0032D8E1B7